MPGFGIEDDELKKLFAEAGEAVKKARVSQATEKEADPLTDVPSASESTASSASPSPAEAGSAPAAPSTPPLFPTTSKPPSLSALSRSSAPTSARPPAPTQPTVARLDELLAAEEANAASRGVPAKGPAPVEPAGVSELDFEVQPIHKAASSESASADGMVRLNGGEQTDTALVARTPAGAEVTIPWAQMQKLSLGRVTDKNVLAFIHNGAVYYFSDDNVVYKGLLKQLAATLAMNWRGLVNEIANRLEDKSDPGVQAVTGGGGTVPKYFEMAGFLAAIRSR